MGDGEERPLKRPLWALDRCPCPYFCLQQQHLGPSKLLWGGGVQGKGTECPPKQPLWALDLCPAHAPILDTLCSLFVFPSLSPVLLAVFDPSFLSVCLCPSSGPNSVSSDFRSHDRGVFIIFIITLTNAGRSLQEIPVTATAPNYRDFSPPGGGGAYP